MSDGMLVPARVMHRRRIAPLYRFAYRLFYVLIDLDQLGRLHRRLRLFSWNVFNVVSFHDRDHGDGAVGGLRRWVDALLATHSITLEGGRVRLLTLPRLFGHGFNPISLYYCEHRDGSLRAVIAEVNNTFGDRHCYLLGASGAPLPDAPLEKAKRLHVSPFLDGEGRYRFRLRPPETRVDVHIEEWQQDRLVLQASLLGACRPLTDRALLIQVMAMPWMTLKVVIGIHWQAVKVWLRGARYRPRPAPPSMEVS